MPEPEPPVPPNTDSATPEPISATALSWAALLSHWMDFARSSVGFPKDGEGDRWRSSVAPVIGLQAVTFALSEVDRLSPSEHAAGLDRAEILIRDHAETLSGIWAGVPMPDLMLELLQDARTALQAALRLGIEWCAESEGFEAHDPTRIAEYLTARSFAGDFFAAQPGTILAADAPIAFLTPRSGTSLLSLDDLIPGAANRPSLGRQILRQVDEEGAISADLIVPLFDRDLPKGRPLLIPILQAGRLVYEHDDDATRKWRDAQLAAGSIPLLESARNQDTESKSDRGD